MRKTAGFGYAKKECGSTTIPMAVLWCSSSLLLVLKPRAHTPRWPPVTWDGPVGQGGVGGPERLPPTPLIRLLLLYSGQWISLAYTNSPCQVYSLPFSRHDKLWGIRIILKRIPKSYGYIKVVCYDYTHQVGNTSSGRPVKLVRQLKLALRRMTNQG